MAEVTLLDDKEADSEEDEPIRYLFQTLTSNRLWIRNKRDIQIFYGTIFFFFFTLFDKSTNCTTLRNLLQYVK